MVQPLNPLPSNYWKNLVTDYGKQDLETRRDWYASVASNYDRLRPRYPDVLIERVMQLAALPPGGRILELGCGPGTATIAFARRGFSLVSLEPALTSAQLATVNCRAFTQVQIENVTFEEWQPTDENFDAVLAATSWHWLTPAIAYCKSHQVLSPGGSLILLWNTPPQPSQELYQYLDPIYQAIAPEIPIYARYDELSVHQEQFQQLEADILASGYFHQVVQEQTVQHLTYPIPDYLDLLSTLSPYIALNPEQREHLFSALSPVLARHCGETVPLTFCSAFHLARKL
jgi:SAM-dependent methyltransferase